MDGDPVCCRAPQLVSRRADAALRDRCAAWCFSGWHWKWSIFETSRYAYPSLTNGNRLAAKHTFCPCLMWFWGFTFFIHGSIISSQSTSKLGGLPGQLHLGWPVVAGHAPGKPKRHSWVSKAWRFKKEDNEHVNFLASILGLALSSEPKPDFWELFEAQYNRRKSLGSGSDNPRSLPCVGVIDHFDLMWFPPWHCEASFSWPGKLRKIHPNQRQFAPFIDVQCTVDPKQFSDW